MDDGFVYKCPDCGTKNILHDTDCKYDYEELQMFEKPYIDLLSVMTAHSAYMKSWNARPVISQKKLVDKVTKLHDKNPWLEVHNDCLERLITEHQIVREDGLLRLTEPGEQVEKLIPGFDPLRTIYEYGPVDGCKDYAVYTMVSWCSLKDMTWEQTSNFVAEWLRESGAWERESWSESSIQQLVNSKNHVWSSNLGWGEMARVAKEEIEETDVSKGIDIRDKYGAEYSDYEDG